MNDTWAKLGFEIWPFIDFLEYFRDIMANLGLIDKIGLYIKVNVNKFEVHI